MKFYDKDNWRIPFSVELWNDKLPSGLLRTIRAIRIFGFLIAIWQ
jgi:hypothetical protein